MNAAEANDTLDKVQALQRALYRAAKASAERRFHALYDKVTREDIVARAWQEVQASWGAAGVDRQSSSAIEEQGVEGFLAELATELREGRYRAQPVRRVQIPKADGQQRPLGIPTVRDRILRLRSGRRQRRSWCWNRSSRPIFGPARPGFGRSGTRTRLVSGSGRR